MKKKKGKNVQATLAYRFYEYHKLKSLDHQTAQLEIKIETNQDATFCKYSCLENSKRRKERKKESQLFRDTLG